MNLWRNPAARDASCCVLLLVALAVCDRPPLPSEGCDASAETPPRCTLAAPDPFDPCPGTTECFACPFGAEPLPCYVATGPGVWNSLCVATCELCPRPARLP